MCHHRRVSTHSPAAKQAAQPDLLINARNPLYKVVQRTLALYGTDRELPNVLTDRNAWLYKLSCVATELRDKDASDRDTWRPVHQAFERHMLSVCPQYKPCKGEYFGTICDSGRDGSYLRNSTLCAACQFIHAEHLPAKPTLTRSAPAPMVQIKEAAQAFAAAATQAVPAEDPCHTTAAVEADLFRFAELVKGIKYAAQQAVIETEEHFIAFYDDYIDSGLMELHALIHGTQGYEAAMMLSEFKDSGLVSLFAARFPSVYRKMTTPVIPGVPALLLAPDPDDDYKAGVPGPAAPVIDVQLAASKLQSWAKREAPAKAATATV